MFSMEDMAINASSLCRLRWLQELVFGQAAVVKCLETGFHLVLPLSNLELRRLLLFLL